MQDQTSPFLVTQIAPFSPLLLPCFPLCPSCLLSSSAFPPIPRMQFAELSCTCLLFLTRFQVLWAQPWLTPKRSHSSRPTPVATGGRVEFFIIPFIFATFLFVIRERLLCGGRKITRGKKKNPDPQKHVFLALPALTHFHLDWLPTTACELLNVRFQNGNLKDWTWNERRDSALHAGGHVFLKRGSSGGSLVSPAYIISWGFLTPALPGALTRRGFRERLLQAELNLVRGIARYLQVTDLDLGWNRRCALPKIQEGCTYGTKTKCNAI